MKAAVKFEASDELEVVTAADPFYKSFLLQFAQKSNKLECLPHFFS
jgi:hypothetical protein